MNDTKRDSQPHVVLMPRYKCHKEVWALRIKHIDGTMIIPDENGYAPIDAGMAYMEKHDPQVGGYYVVYKDGYTSFSPAEAFEKGYTLIATVADQETVNITAADVGVVSAKDLLGE